MGRSPLRLWLIGVISFVIPMVIILAISRNLRKPSGPVTYVHQADPDLQVAIETAQRSLPDFMAALAKPKPEQRGFALKVRLSSGSNKEMVWVDHVHFDGKVFQGQLADQPVLVTGQAKGDPISVPITDVVDWTIVYDGGAHEGAFTDAVLRRRQSLRYPPAMLTSPKRLA